MASGMYNNAKYEVLTGSMRLGSDTLKAVLVGAGYTFDADHVFIDEGTSGDIQSNELSATNYSGGFNGSGRKTLTPTAQANNTSDRGEMAFADLTWSSLGAPSGEGPVAGVAIVKEITNDAASKLVAYYDITDRNINGGDFTIDFLALGSGGNLRLT